MCSSVELAFLMFLYRFPIFLKSCFLSCYSPQWKTDFFYLVQACESYKIENNLWKPIFFLCNYMKKIVTEFCIVCSYKSTGLIENPVCITVSLLIFLIHICCLKHINSIAQIYYCVISYLSICVFVGEKEWGSGEEGDPELEIWCGKPRSWLTTVPAAAMLSAHRY